MRGCRWTVQREVGSTQCNRSCKTNCKKALSPQWVKELTDSPAPPRGMQGRKSNWLVTVHRHMRRSHFSHQKAKTATIPRKDPKRQLRNMVKEPGPYESLLCLYLTLTLISSGRTGQWGGKPHSFCTSYSRESLIYTGLYSHVPLSVVQWDSQGQQTHCFTATPLKCGRHVVNFR